MAHETEVNELLEKIAKSLATLSTLTVTTVVSPLEIIELDDHGTRVAAGAQGVNWTVAPPPSGPADAWATEVNLLDGKIRNTLSPQFATGGLSSLSDFHKSQVQQAKEIVHGNIQALITLARTIKDLV